MDKSSPKIAIESRILTVPIFKVKTLTCKNTPIISMPAIRLDPTSFPSKVSKDLPISKRASSCKCTHVLVADDDPFQKLYYQALFQKSIEFNTINLDKDNFRVKIVKSGEELITNYLKSQACGCGTLMLIITDYHMGKHKINGIQVALHLRKLGCKETIFLRTSESREGLAMNHKDLEALLSKKTINSILDKKSHLETKSKVQKILMESTK